MKDQMGHINNLESGRSLIPQHSIVSTVDLIKTDSKQWVINIKCPFVFSNALKFNLFEEIPLVEGDYTNVEEILKLILGDIPYEDVSELNLHFNDCHVVLLKEQKNNVVYLIEDILSNLFQHLPHISKYEDMVPEVIYIPLQMDGEKLENSCFKKWGLHYPNESELIVYSLEDRSLEILDSLDLNVS